MAARRKLEAKSKNDDNGGLESREKQREGYVKKTNTVWQDEQNVQSVSGQ